MASETPFDELTGIGLKFPLQWGGAADFAWSAGRPLVVEKMAVALGTACSSPRSVGDLPYAPRTGSRLEPLRNRHMRPEDRDGAAYLAAEAIGTQVRHAIVRGTEADADRVARSLAVRVRWDLRTGGQADQVVRSGLEDRLEVL